MTTSKCKLITIALTAIGLGLLLHAFHNLTKPLPAPQLDSNRFWGPHDESQYRHSDEIRSKHIHYDAAIIDQLRVRLGVANATDYHAPLEDAAWHSYGIDTQTLLDFVRYWGGEYLDKWPQREALLNSVPHFETEIQGLNIHFIHIKSERKGAAVRPLLLLHGWPSTVRDFYDMIPMLTSPDDAGAIAFDVIAPSLPGYAWSDGPAKRGFGAAEMAVVLRNLMLRLGYAEFYVQGGDWGSFVGSHLATLYPENVRGYHSNFCVPKTLLSTVKLLVASVWPTLFVAEEFAEQVFPLADKFKILLLETGSFHMQATKPETLTAMLYDPIALATYLQEKFISALPDHNVDDVLDNLMIYYLTNSFGTSARLYAEDIADEQAALELGRVPTPVPTACVRFPRDLGQSLDWQLRDKYPNLVQSSWYSVGGHFAAMEVPDVLYRDFYAFVRKVEGGRV